MYGLVKIKRAFAEVSCTIEGKLTIIILTACSISILITGLFLTVFYVNDLRSSFKDDLYLTTKVINESLAAALAFNDTDRIQEVLAALGGNENINFACLYNEENKLVEQYSSQSAGYECQDQFSKNVFDDSGMFDVVVPIAQKQLTIGQLVVVADVSSFYIGAYRQFAFVGFVIISVLLAISYPISRRLQKRVSQPLLELTNSSRALTKGSSELALFVDDDEDELRYLQSVFGVVNSYLEKIRAGEIVHPDMYSSVSLNQDLIVNYLKHETRKNFLAQTVSDDLIRRHRFGYIDANYVSAFEVNKDLSEKLKADVEIIQSLIQVEKEALAFYKEYQELEPLVRGVYDKVYKNQTVKHQLEILEEGSWGLWPVYEDAFLLFCESLFKLLKQMQKTAGQYTYIVSFEKRKGGALLSFECMMSNSEVIISEGFNFDADNIEDYILKAKFAHNINSPDSNKGLEIGIEENAVVIRGVIPCS